MSQLTFTLKLKTPLASIERSALNHLKHKLNSVLNAAVPGIKQNLGNLIATKLKASPEYVSIIGGDLNAELGIQNAAAIMEGVLNAIINSIIILPKAITIRSGVSLTGGMRIQILRSDFSDILTVPGVSYQSEGGYIIPWLQWLLFAGDKIIVADYEVIFHNDPDSRTGKALMRKHRGRGYRLSPAYSGTPKNNFITRALEGVEQDIENIIRLEISRRV